MPGASIPPVETLNPPGFALDSARWLRPQRSLSSAAPSRRATVKLEQSNFCCCWPWVYPSFIHTPQVTESNSICFLLMSVFSTLVACYHANIRRHGRLCRFSWFPMEAEVTWFPGQQVGRGSSSDNFWSHCQLCGQLPQLVSFCKNTSQKDCEKT